MTTGSESFNHNITDSQMPHDLVDMDWKAYKFVKHNVNTTQAWTAEEILEFLNIYKFQTINNRIHQEGGLTFEKN